MCPCSTLSCSGSLPAFRGGPWCGVACALGSVFNSVRNVRSLVCPVNPGSLICILVKSNNTAAAMGAVDAQVGEKQD